MPSLTASVALWSHGGVNLERFWQGGKVGMVAESGTFDGFELGKGLAELVEEFVPFFGDVLSGFVMVGTQQDVAFQKNLWVIPPASA